MFFGCIVLLDSKETKLGTRNQRASPSAGKNSGTKPCCSWKPGPTAISGGVGVSEIPGCHLLQEMSSQ